MTDWNVGYSIIWYVGSASIVHIDCYGQFNDICRSPHATHLPSKSRVCVNSSVASNAVASGTCLVKYGVCGYIQYYFGAKLYRLGQFDSGRR